MKIYLFGQRNNLGGGKHFSNFVDAMKSLAAIGGMIEEVEVSGKKSILSSAGFSQRMRRFFSFLFCLKSLLKEPS